MWQTRPHYKIQINWQWKQIVTISNYVKKVEKINEEKIELSKHLAGEKWKLRNQSEEIERKSNNNKIKTQSVSSIQYRDRLKNWNMKYNLQENGHSFKQTRVLNVKSTPFKSKQALCYRCSLAKHRTNDAHVCMCAVCYVRWYRIVSS